MKTVLVLTTLQKQEVGYTTCLVLFSQDALVVLGLLQFRINLGLFVLGL